VNRKYAILASGPVFAFTNTIMKWADLVVVYQDNQVNPKEFMVRTNYVDLEHDNPPQRVTEGVVAYEADAPHENCQWKLAYLDWSYRSFAFFSNGVKPARPDQINALDHLFVEGSPRDDPYDPAPIGGISKLRWEDPCPSSLNHP
jgi:hypothetical protein